ncbi:MAG: division/cell wall cluster transcriptional repressor MraZ [Cyclobacteriaceae bacterium]|nr:division/cell wall cluster transcriptional repressor MraZ [Cyclobacteriaceae bacterium]
MSMFFGEYECKLDSKGRLVLPSRLKSRLPDVSSPQVVLVKGIEPCLVMYPLEEFHRIYARVASMNEFDATARTVQRNLYRRVLEIDLDTTGRFLIPKVMLQHAGLDKDVIVVGAGNRIEIWTPDQYEKFIIEDSDQFSEMTQKHVKE